MCGDDLIVKIDTYKFMGSDVNPTAKKIEDGKPTDELYEKEKIYKVIKEAVIDGRITDSLKISNISEEYIKYVFKNKSQKIEVLIPNPNFIDENVMVETIDSKLKIDNSLSNVDYINQFDSLIKMKADIIYKNIINNMALAISSVALVGSMVGGVIYSDMKEYELKSQQNRELIDEINEQRRKNGVEDISYLTPLEKTVDDAIEASNIGGRKL